MCRFQSGKAETTLSKDDFVSMHLYGYYEVDGSHADLFGFL